MRITAALCWYDERPDMLDRCVRSLAGVVDTLVTLDGRWELHADGAPALSPAGQVLTIEQAAGEVLLPTYLYSRPRVWPDQVTKRACLMAAAAEYGDWILVIDADEYVSHADPDGLRETLAATDRLVGGVMHTNIRPGSSAVRWKRRGIRRVYPAGTTVVGAHNGYRYIGRWLHGDPAHVSVEPYVDLWEVLQLDHDKSTRPARRRSERATYHALRNQQKVEAW